MFQRQAVAGFLIRAVPAIGRVRVRDDLVEATSQRKRAIAAAIVDDDALHRFEAALAKLPEVLEAYLLTGESDYFIKVAVSGTADYERFLREKLYRIPGINHSRTSFALRCLKRTFSALPEKYLER